MGAQAVTRERVPSAHDAGGLSVRVSDAPDDPDWDDFVERAPGSSYTQTSCWGRARESIGWRPVRVIVSEDGQVVGGAQIEIRSLPAGGNVGFVFGGPVLASDRPELARLVLDEMMALGRARKVRYLAVQTPRGCDSTYTELTRRGFRRGVLDYLYIYYAASVVLDLRTDAEALLAKMSKKRRQNIGSARKRGVTVRRGSEADLPLFNRLKDAHAARLGYDRREEGYYEKLWHELSPRRHIELFIAEYEGEAVSAQLAIPFGSTSHHVERPWSGMHPELRTSELVEWEAIRWAGEEGYLSADLGGIEESVADAVLSGGENTVEMEHGDSLFKLKWGGRVVVNPPFLDYVYNPVLRVGYRCIPRGLMRSAWMEKLAKGLRGAGS